MYSSYCEYKLIIVCVINLFIILDTANASCEDSKWYSLLLTPNKKRRKLRASGPVDRLTGCCLGFITILSIKAAVRYSKNELQPVCYYVL